MSDSFSCSFDLRPCFSGALELDLATLHARASTYLPNVTKADLRKAIGPGPFALDQLQELFSKRPQQVLLARSVQAARVASLHTLTPRELQEADFQTQYARFLSTRAAKLTPAEAAAQQLEDWQDIGKVISSAVLPSCTSSGNLGNELWRMADDQGGPGGSPQVPRQCGHSSAHCALKGLSQSMHCTYPEERIQDDAIVWLCCEPAHVLLPTTTTFNRSFCMSGCADILARILHNGTAQQHVPPQQVHSLLALAWQCASLGSGTDRVA